MKQIKNLLYIMLIKILKRRNYNLVKIFPDDVHLYARLYGKESTEKKRFCNISAGGHFDFGCGIHHPCWTNVDLDRPWKIYDYGKNALEYDSKKDIAHDFLESKPLPLEDSCIELVHSRNSIEHLPDSAVNSMLGECFRILKPGGIIRIGAPDIDHLYNVYRNNDREFFNWFDSSVSIEQAFLIHFASHASSLHAGDEGVAEKISDEELKDVFSKMKLEDALNYCTEKCSIDVYKKDRLRLSSLQTHINWWNREKLSEFLKNAGFSKVYASAPEQSLSPVMRNTYYFDNFANYSMFYMEAVK